MVGGGVTSGNPSPHSGMVVEEGPLVLKRHSFCEVLCLCCLWLSVALLGIPASLLSSALGVHLLRCRACPLPDHGVAGGQIPVGWSSFHISGGQSETCGVGQAGPRHGCINRLLATCRAVLTKGGLLDEQLWSGRITPRCQSTLCLTQLAQPHSLIGAKLESQSLEGLGLTDMGNFCAFRDVPVNGSWWAIWLIAVGLRLIFFDKYVS